MTEEKTAKIEKLKTDLATKLEAGEITQEEYDEKFAKSEAGNFKLGSKDGRNLKGERKNNNNQLPQRAIDSSKFILRTVQEDEPEQSL